MVRVNHFKKHPWTITNTLENMLHRNSDWRDIHRNYSHLYSLHYNGYYITFHANRGGYGTLAVTNQCGKITPSVIYLSRDFDTFMDMAIRFSRELSTYALAMKMDYHSVKDYPSSFVNMINFESSQFFSDTY